MRLEDLVNTSNTVKLTKGETEVFGIGVGDIASILVRFPALQAVANGENADIMTILSVVAPEAVPIILSIGLGRPGKKGEALVKNLPPVDQVRVLRKVIELTFPDGIASFVQEIEAMVPADLKNSKPEPQLNLPEIMDPSILRL